MPRKPSPQLLEILKRWTGGSIKLIKNEHSKARTDIVLERPDKKNCLSGTMMLELGEKVNQVDSGVVVLSGEGTSFCSGADLGIINDISTARLGVEMYEYMSSVLRKLHKSDTLSVALIRGHCLGGATEICSAADIRIAHVKSKIAFLQAKLGIVPSWGGADYLERIMGRPNALYAMTTAKVMTAEEAHRLGYVSHVFHSDDEAEEYISSLTKNGAALTKAQKAMLQAVENNDEAEKKTILKKNWEGEVHRNNLNKQMKAVLKK